MSIKRMIMPIINTRIRKYLELINDINFNKIEEIRLRVLKPVMISYEDNDYFIRLDGNLIDNTKSEVLIATQEDINSSLELISNYSLYAFDEELRNGYITVEGGHRVGITGKTVVEKNQVKTIRYISGLNIRIAHEVIGCANRVMKYVVKDKSIYHTLIVSPPKCGKTTLLRDIIRQLSDGNQFLEKGINVGVVDERSEIGGCYKGIPQNKIGIRTDILDACPKIDGMMMLLRSMAPKVIAVDEIGSTGDLEAIENILNAGIKLICTVHGNSIEDLKNKPVLNKILDKKIFERYIFLSNNNSSDRIKAILDKNKKYLLKNQVVSNV